jgi:hypothetical protein
MRYVAACALALALTSGVRAIAPPVERPPATVSSPHAPHGPLGRSLTPFVIPGGGHTEPPPPIHTPEPASLTIAGIGIAAVGAYRLLRRQQKV